MGGYESIKRVCSFYVSSVHLITMIVPYIKRQLALNIGMTTFYEYNLKNKAEEILDKIILPDEERTAMLSVDWNSKNAYKFSEIEKELKKNLKENKELNILITGDNKYIEAANENLENFFMKNMKKIEGKYITIINCYEVTQFNDNVKDILDAHDVILNTSGIHKISDVFEGYTRKVVV
ncbi:MAG: hypothetical protein FWC79_00990 [Oscillospiraceae bacterium]|nr:hypothetical protein [Oscillospiraceae bacterium]